MSDVLPWDEIPRTHQMMWRYEHKPDNMAVLVNAPRTGPLTLEDVVEAGEVASLIGLPAIAPSRSASA